MNKVRAKKQGIAKVTIFLWALAAIEAPLSFAAQPALYCEPLDRLNDRITGCVDNELVFGDAAVTCLERFEKEVENTGKNFAKTLLGTGVSAAKIKKQKGHFAGSEKNYGEVSAKLLYLIGIGKMALSQVEEYKNNLAAPEDVENAGMMGFTTEKFLASIPCYDENRKLLETVAGDFRQKLKELESARAAATKMGATLSASKKNIDRNSSLVDKAASTKGKSAILKQGNKAKNSNSDITGTKKKRSVLPVGQ